MGWFVWHGLYLRFQLAAYIHACRSRGDLLREPPAAGRDPSRGVRALPADGARLHRPAAASPPQLLHPQLRRRPRPGRPRCRCLLHLPARGWHRRPPPRLPAAKDTTGRRRPKLRYMQNGRQYATHVTNVQAMTTKTTTVRTQFISTRCYVSNNYMAYVYMLRFVIDPAVFHVAAWDNSQLVHVSTLALRS